jgi:hypothetical protein
MPSKVGQYNEPVKLNHRDGASKRGAQNGVRSDRGTSCPPKESEKPLAKLPKK